MTGGAVAAEVRWSARPADALRVVDLFCGAGLASHGLRQAGLQPVLGVDMSPNAVHAYRENIGAVLECDLGQPLDARSAAALSQARAGVVWLSLPGGMRSAQTARTWSLDQPGEQLLLNALRAAAHCRPVFVVLEWCNEVAPPQVLVRRMAAQLPGFQRADVFTLDAHRDAGSPAQRERLYLIWTLRGWVRPWPVAGHAPTGTVRDMIDMSLPARIDARRMGEQRLAAVQALLARGGGVVALPHYRQVLDFQQCLRSLDEAHPEMQPDSQFLYVYEGRWRAAAVADWRRARGMPADFVLAGNRAAQMRQMATATDARVAALIGRSLIRALGV